MGTVEQVVQVVRALVLQAVELVARYGRGGIRVELHAWADGPGAADASVRQVVSVTYEGGRPSVAVELPDVRVGRDAELRAFGQDAGRISDVTPSLRPARAGAPIPPPAPAPPRRAR